MYYPRELFSIDESRTARNIDTYERRHIKIWDTYYSRYTAEERKTHNIRTRHEIIKAIEKEIDNQ